MLKGSFRTALLFLSGFALASAVFAADSKVSVTPPAGWKKMESSSALAQYMKKGASFIVTRDTVPSDIKTPDAYVAFVKKMYEKSLKNVKYETVKKLTVAGCDARELVYTADAYGMKMKYDVIYVFKGGSAYTLTAGYLTNGFENFKADFKAFFDSFKFI